MPRTSSCCVSSRYAAASQMGTRSAHAASCLLRVAREHLFAAAAPDPLFGSTLFVCLSGSTLVVCLFVCVFVCLRRALAKHTVDGAAYAAIASSRGDGLFALCCAGVRCACTRAPTPPSCCRTAPLRMRKVPPKRRVLCYSRVAPAPESPHRQTRLHVSTRSRTGIRP
jgi:hypothetical protein